MEQTLDNLGTHSVDVYFLHNFDFGPGDAYLSSVIEQMRAFRAQGLVRAIGMRGLHRFALERLTTPKAKRGDKHARFREVFGLVQPDVLAVRYNLGPPARRRSADQQAARARVAHRRVRPRATPVFGPGDHRSRKRWFTPAALAVLREGLAPLRQRFGSRPADLVRVALRFCLQRAEDAAVLVGFTTPAQVEMNLTCLGAPLTAEDLTFVRATMQALGQALDAAGGVFLDDVTA